MPGRPPCRPPWRPTLPALAALLLVLATGSACTDSDDQGESPVASVSSSDTPTAEPAAPTVPTRLSTGAVTGRIAKQRCKDVVARVGETADRWLEAAYVGGDYPRGRFGKSFPGFTAVAARTARGDRDLMSNADLGDRIDAVVVKRRSITVDLLATRGRARAATAHVDLAFKTSGTVRRVRVTGRLFLTQQEGRWRVFGYDVAKASA
jgi:hypothetical protein